MPNTLTNLNVQLVDNQGNVLMDRESREIRRNAVKQILKNNLIRINYTRSKKKNPNGLVLSQISGGKLYVGWSKLRRREVWDRNYGILYALSRLTPIENILNNNKSEDGATIPHNIRREMAHLLARNVVYYRGKTKD